MVETQDHSKNKMRFNLYFVIWLEFQTFGYMRNYKEFNENKNIEAEILEY